MSLPKGFQLTTLFKKSPNPRVFLIGLILFTPCQLDGAEKWNAEKLQSLEQEILNQRKKMTSFCITVDCNNNFISSKYQANHQLKVAIDGKKILMEKIILPSKMREIYVQNGDVSGYSFRFFQTNSDKKGRGTFKEGPLNKEDLNIPVRTLGISFGRFLPSTHKAENLDGLFGDLFKKPDLISEVNLDGVNCLKITHKRENGFVDEIWIDLSRGPSIIKRELVADRYSLHFSNDLQYHEPSRLWFVKTRTFEIRSKGVVSEMETATVTIHSLNQTLDPKVFEVESMNLSPGSQIDEHPLKSSFPVIVNDDFKIVPADEYGSPEPEPKDRSKWWGRAAVTSGILALLFGARFLRNRRKQES